MKLKERFGMIDDEVRAICRWLGAVGSSDEVGMRRGVGHGKKTEMMRRATFNWERRSSAYRLPWWDEALIDFVLGRRQFLDVIDPSMPSRRYLRRVVLALQWDEHCRMFQMYNSFIRVHRRGDVL